MSAALLVVLAAAGLRAPRWIAFAQQAAFEVASIKPNQSGTEGTDFDMDNNGRLSVVNATLRALIRNAYRVQNDQIKGGAKWIDADRWNIEAKTAAPIRSGEAGPLLQNLLADRFQLKTHRETAEMPVYALRVGKNGPKFKANTGGESDSHTHHGTGKVEVSVTGESMGRLAEILSRQLGRVVEDKTGLTGRYDFTLEWDPAQTPDSTIPSIFTALQEQLGLRLESGKGPVEVLVIDQVEKPTEN
jgi:uncharacterized protein (TIGR03435 family)